MIDLDNLLIYKEYMQLIFFTLENIEEDNQIKTKEDIKKITYEGLNDLVMAHKEKDLAKKLILLKQLDASMQTLKVLVKVSSKKKYFNKKTVTSWNKKLINISNLTWTWMESCLKEESIYN